MKKLKIFSSGIAMLVCLLLSTVEIHAKNSEKTVTGVVSDATGPIPGANVHVVGTTKIAQTDIDGKYSIKVKKGQILEFSFVGMQSKRVEVAKSNIINVTLNEGVTLNEVVVSSSLGIRRIRDAVPSSQQLVKASEFAQPAQPAPSSQLVGKVSGVAINANHRGATKVTLRGNRSMSANNQALVVIDGKISTLKELQKIPAKKLKHTNVIKGPQATALYGSAAVNGVIIANTKGHSRSTFTDHNQEDYESFVENQFESPKNTALSTFSIDVDNASYTNVRRFINLGQKVPRDAVRVEEMVNFFKYKYPQPKDGHPFSINSEYGDCPWNKNHRLIRIGLQGKILSGDNLPASNLVFLIDVSGSMQTENKLPLLQQSLKILTAELRAEDKVSIVVYAGSAGLVLAPTSGADKKTIISAIDNLSAGGSTAGGAGILLAYKTATDHFIKGGNNRVILATDGDFNVGASSPADMETLIEDKRKSGVFLTCLGYGMGNYKDSRLELLADKGNGNYAYIDNIQEAKRFLSREFKGSMYAIAKDVKIQVEFNPKQVQAYRLIGYENRKLRDEDFVNDTIDAGELGSGHTVTALYEIVPVGVKSVFTSELPKLKYSKVQLSDKAISGELATIKFRYKNPDGDKSIEMTDIVRQTGESRFASSSDFKFSAAVAWFGLNLRDSKLISDRKFENIKKLAKDGLADDTDGYKAEFIRLVESAGSI